MATRTACLPRAKSAASNGSKTRMTSAGAGLEDSQGAGRFEHGSAAVGIAELRDATVDRGSQLTAVVVARVTGVAACAVVLAVGDAGAHAVTGRVRFERILLRLARCAVRVAETRAIRRDGPTAALSAFVGQAARPRRADIARRPDVVHAVAALDGGFVGGARGHCQERARERSEEKGHLQSPPTIAKS